MKVTFTDLCVTSFLLGFSVSSVSEDKGPVYIRAIYHEQGDRVGYGSSYNSQDWGDGWFIPPYPYVIAISSDRLHVKGFTNAWVTGNSDKLGSGRALNINEQDGARGCPAAAVTSYSSNIRASDDSTKGAVFMAAPSIVYVKKNGINFYAIKDFTNIRNGVAGLDFGFNKIKGYKDYSLFNPWLVTKNGGSLEHTKANTHSFRPVIECERIKGVPMVTRAVLKETTFLGESRKAHILEHYPDYRPVAVAFDKESFQKLAKAITKDLKHFNAIKNRENEQKREEAKREKLKLIKKQCALDWSHVKDEWSKEFLSGYDGRVKKTYNFSEKDHHDYRVKSQIRVWWISTDSISGFNTHAKLAIEYDGHTYETKPDRSYNSASLRQWIDINDEYGMWAWAKKEPSATCITFEVNVVPK